MDTFKKDVDLREVDYANEIWIKSEHLEERDVRLDGRMVLELSSKHGM